MQKYSQLGQEHWVLSILKSKRNGLFVDIGAVDGIVLSNTYLLEKEFGWTGLCVEPSRQFLKLKENRKCKIDKRAVFNIDGETLDFLEDYSRGEDNRFSGILKSLDSYQRSGINTQVESVRLETLLNEHKIPKNIDYLSIDTEGSEWQIIEGFDFSEWNIKLISIEHNMHDLLRKKIFFHLSKYGYFRDFLQASNWDDWYYHSSMAHQFPEYFYDNQETFIKNRDHKIYAAIKQNQLL